VQDILEMREATDQTFYRFVENSYTEWFWNLLRERADPDVEHSVLLSLTGLQGSGKSLSAISICSFLDPDFSVDRIYFGYNDLVYDRQNIRQNTAVLIDEQSQAFGLDSHRVNIILTSLKEQLRKKSIHFIFCAPVLYPEHETSMYILETIFINYETMECCACLKTREGLTLGHVMIPHPLKILEDGSQLQTKEFLDAYQAKKDQQLEKVLGQRDTDIFEERAQRIMAHEYFKKAEQIYVNRMGYIPSNTVVQIINKLMPEFNAGVVPLEIAGRIKLNKEISGEWVVAGKKITAEDRGAIKRGRKS
jgi:ABC-type dipeptide/oligopeptide/nickel transport system ATPase component